MNARFTLPLLLSLPLAAQQPGLQQTLTRAAAQADALQSHLPSFTCRVSGHSDVLHKGQLARSVPFHGTIRAVRGADGRMREDTTYTDVDGKPYNDKHHPYFVHGGFTDVLTYVSSALQSCSDFTPGPDGRVDFAAHQPTPKGCGLYTGMRGFFTTDADGNVTHIERTLPPSDDDWTNLVPFAVVDLKPVELKGQTYRLASHIRSERPMEDVVQRFEADYTDCKLFTTEFRILPGVTPVDGAEPPE